MLSLEEWLQEGRCRTHRLLIDRSHCCDAGTKQGGFGAGMEAVAPVRALLEVMRAHTRRGEKSDSGWKL